MINNHNSIIKFLRLKRREIRFIILFVLFFSFGQMLHYHYRFQIASVVVNHYNAKVSSHIINFLTPGENTSAQDRVIKSDKVRLEIALGCEGIEAVILVTAAICAFSAGIWAKFLGILLGTLIIYLSNLARIIGLYYTLRYIPNLFSTMHVYVGQTVIIFIGVLFFITWTLNCAKIRQKNN